MTLKIQGIILVGAMLVHGIVNAQSPQAQIKEITDTRTTGSFFKGLKIDMAFVGDSLDTARGVRAIRITKAVDNTGRSLLKPEEKNPLHPYHYVAFGTGFGKTELALLNPSRQATAIQQLNGEALFHLPQRDPASIVTVPALQKQFGKPIHALEAKGIKLVVLDKAAADKLNASGQLHQPGGALPPAKNGGEKVADELVAMMKRLGQAFSTVGENDIQFVLEDPKSVVVDFELRDGAGKKIETGGRMFFNESQYTMSLRNPLPADAQLLVYLATPKSIVNVAFKMTGVALP